MHIYKLITFVLTPFIYLYLVYRLFKGKEDKNRFTERLGNASIKRPGDKFSDELLWFHAASVGEANSVLPLMEALLQNHSNINILFTTGTVTSAKILEDRLLQNANGKKIIHQYVPVDTPGAVAKFINHWQPDFAFWVESEFWPNLINKTSKSGCKIFLINARLSDASYKKWKRMKKLAKKIMSCFTLCLPQSLKDGERLHSLGAKELIYLGNLKSDSKPLPVNKSEYNKLLGFIGDRKLWLAASIHKGEELSVGKTHLNLKKQYNNLLTIIAPRHPDKSEIMQETFSKLGLTVSVRSKNDPINKATDIYLADTMGELGVFYQLATITFMGGSLIKHGGQNPLEPARFGNAIITGKYFDNFEDVYSQMHKANAAVIVNNEKELIKKLNELFASNQTVNKTAESATKFAKSQKGLVNKYAEVIGKYLQ